MSARNETVVLVERTLPQERLDRFLRSQFPTLSRGAIQRLIQQGDIRVDGKSVKATHHPRAGEKIGIHWPDARPSTAQPQEIPLAILFEDDDLLVISKPPGMVVHPSAWHQESTLVNALLHHCAGQLSGIGGVARPGIVHRLDKETSGCLVVAKNDPTHLALSTQFAGREVEKVYHAIVCGAVTPQRGDIRAAIARHPTHRKRMAVTDGGGRRHLRQPPEQTPERTDRLRRPAPDAPRAQACLQTSAYRKGIEMRSALAGRFHGGVGRAALNLPSSSWQRCSLHWAYSR